jgi:hypothetical protein
VVRDRFIPSVALDVTEALSEGDPAEIGMSPSLS